MACRPSHHLSAWSEEAQLAPAAAEVQKDGRICGVIGGAEQGLAFPDVTPAEEHARYLERRPQPGPQTALPEAALQQRPVTKTQSGTCEGLR
jgi:hypothetical protein